MASFGHKPQDILTKENWELILQDAPDFPFFELVWPKYYVPKWSLCLYRAVVDALPNLDMIQQWIPAIKTSCVLCGEESTGHLFFNCSYSLYIS